MCQFQVAGEDAALETVTDPVSFLFEVMDLVEVVLDRLDVLEERPCGDDDRFHRRAARLGKLAVTVVKLSGHRGVFDRELVQAGFCRIDDVVAVFEKSQHVAAMIRNQGMTVKVGLDFLAQLVRLGLQLVDAHDGILEIGGVPRQVSQHTGPVDKATFADRVEKAVDFCFDVVAGLEERHAYSVSFGFITFRRQAT